MENDASIRWKAAVSRATNRLEKGMFFSTRAKEHLVECYRTGVFECVTKGIIKTLFKFTPQYFLIATVNEITEHIMGILLNISFCYQLCLSEVTIAKLGLYVFTEVAKTKDEIHESEFFDYHPDL